MSNLAIDININAPALVGALERLTVALGKPVTLEAKPMPVPQPVQTAPVTPAPAAAAMPQQEPAQPAAVPVTPAPVQTAAAPVAPAPVQTAAPQAPVQAAPAAAPTTKTYTMDEIAKAAADFMSPATIPQLQALLASFGVNGLPDLPADKLGAFAAELRKMGAKI